MRERINVGYLPAQYLDDYWSEVYELLEPAQRRVARNLTMDDLKEDIASGVSILWLVHVEDKLCAAITTSLHRHPQRTTFKIDFIGGSGMRTWFNVAAKALVDAAKSLGADALEADARNGWAKYAPRVGFKPTWTHYEMEI